MCVRSSITSLEGGGGAGLVAKLSLTLTTPWTVAYQSPLSMGFFRQGSLLLNMHIAFL